ncbi:methyltransferase domain-containing protein [Anaplasma bovis]|uniref:methyltransferase domain-containing protein n=1 Tax=Anaplasma bovis TaxID=186733 RepID=UPI002FF09506
MLRTHLESEFAYDVRHAFDEASAGYDDYASLQKDIAQKLCRLVGKIEEHQSVLDVGCGTGIVGNTIGRKCCLYQLDVSEKMCCIAREKNKAVLTVNGNMNYMPFRNEFFTAVISSMAMHWVEDISRAFKSIIRISKKEGRGIFVSIPVEGTFKELLGCYEMLGMNSKHEFYSVSAIEEMLSNLGVKITYVECEQRTTEHRTFFEFVNVLRKTGSHVPRTSAKVDGDESIKKVSSLYRSVFSNQSKIVSSWNIAYFVIKR